MNSNKKQSSDFHVDKGGDKYDKIKLVNWKLLIVIILTIILLLAVCFISYPKSNGESIMQHVFF